MQYLVIQAKIPTFEYSGSPRNLYEFADELLLKSNKTFGTLYHVSEALKRQLLTPPDKKNPIKLRFTSEADLIKFLRNFTYIIKVDGQYYITPKKNNSNPA